MELGMIGLGTDGNQHGAAPGNSGWPPVRSLRPPAGSGAGSCQRRAVGAMSLEDLAEKLKPLPRSG